ncbi:MAG: hypothetical protein A2847_01560 [Candidatus Sungbacteria bacterium RIFCSPHIGHO2_01_FULL_50_25]|uniref:Uncharacterized protein n=1 Tax=Candidatus Sungbacteria bacterium RIFCSPHIGHO2_01_FULL_50_25 TaxID=1802265 RepID=A0A1G2KB69_9BACT|nr:MAG: hypothetical protein A2847_01560 [Candidatus Sungbacteria bacterium RIFCSPHIGHO2_01_FULL_50_25]
MRCFRRFILASFVLVAFGAFFQFFSAFASDADEILVEEYKNMLSRQKELIDTRQRILLLDQGLAMPKVLDDDARKRQQLLDSLLKYIVTYERVCARYNTDMEAFGKRFGSQVNSSGAIGLDPCLPLSVSRSR